MSTKLRKKVNKINPARTSALTLFLANLYILFSDDAPPVFNISNNLFSYGDNPTTSETSSLTSFVRLERR